MIWGKRYRREVEVAQQRADQAEQSADRAEEETYEAAKQRAIVGLQAVASIQKTESLRHQVRLNGFTELLASAFGRKGQSA